MITCPHQSSCGGCPLIELSYEEQLLHKRARVQTACAPYASEQGLTVETVPPSPKTVGYRTRAKLIAGPLGTLGLYRNGGEHQVVDIPGCLVLAPALADASRIIRELIVDQPGMRSTADGGGLRAVDLREVVQSDGARVLVTLIFEQPKTPERGELLAIAHELSRRCPAILGVALNSHDGKSPQVLGHHTEVLTGPLRTIDQADGHYVLATHGSFVQAHREQARAIHAQIAERLERYGCKSVLDLYGGSGATALPLARQGLAVTMVESFAPAAELLQSAASEQKISGIQVRVGDVAAITHTLLTKGERFDGIVVNPPRRGVSPDARETIARLAPKVIVYVSCDPDTLARDLSHFRDLGYAASKLSPHDLIPLTDEVETVAVLTPRGKPKARVLYDEGNWLVVEKPAHETLSLPQEGLAPGATLRAFFEQGTLVAHRLDARESGALLLSRDGSPPSKLRTRFTVMVKGVTPTRGRLATDGDKLTRFTRLAILTGHSLLQLQFEGVERHHTLRARLSSMGHPVLGDPRFGHAPTNTYFEQKYGLDRSFFHASGFEWTASGRTLRVQSPLPGDLRALCVKLGAPLETLS